MDQALSEPTPAPEPGIDFAVLGNDAEALEWIERTLAATPTVRLLGEHEEPPTDRSAHVAVGVVGSLERQLEDLSRPRRLAFVLRDPVRVLAEAHDRVAEDPPTPRYARVVSAHVLNPDTDTLVLAAEELAGSESVVSRLIEHIGVAGERPGAPAPATGASISAGRRAVLFASVRDDIEELEQMTGRVFTGWRYGAQQSAPRAHAARRHPRALVYVGRRRAIEVPADATSLTDWDVLPVRLAPLLDDAERLTIVDPLSFPFELLRHGDRDIPVIVELPTGWEPPVLDQLLGVPLLRHISPFDLVGTRQDQVFRALRRLYSWPARIRVGSAVALSSYPVSASRRAEKAAWRVLAGPIRRQLDTGAASVPPGEQLRGALLADKLERWAALFRLGHCELIGWGEDPPAVNRAAASFPEWTFQSGLPDSPDPETVHVALAVDALSKRSGDERRRRLRALIHALRVGGRLIVLDVFLQGRGGCSTAAPSPRELVADVLQASNRHTVLEHVEAIRLPGDDLLSVGLFAFSKIGRPERM